MRKQYNIVAALSLFCSINASAQFSASYPNHDGSYVSSTFFNQYPDLFNTLVEKPKAAELFKFPEPDISYATGKINLQIPIYTMDLQLLTLPLTLQYNSSGIRIQDKPGVAGYVNGKELDLFHGLNWYDYLARGMDPAAGRFTAIDPLCEKYFALSPYVF